MRRQRAKLVLICVPLLFAAMITPARSSGIGGQQGGSSYVTPKQAVSALLASLRGTDLQSVQLPDSAVMGLVPARVSNPEIKVLEVNADIKHGVLYARMRCLHYECVPFHIRFEPVEFSRPEADSFVRLVFRDTRNVTKSLGSRRASVVNAGQVATLLIRSPGMQLSLPVVCLQPGAVGESIRLRAVGTGKVLVGRVEAKGVLSTGGATR